MGTTQSTRRRRDTGPTSVAADVSLVERTLEERVAAAEAEAEAALEEARTARRAEAEAKHALAVLQTRDSTAVHASATAPAPAADAFSPTLSSAEIAANVTWNTCNWLQSLNLHVLVAEALAPPTGVNELEYFAAQLTHEELNRTLSKHGLTFLLPAAA